MADEPEFVYWMRDADGALLYIGLTHDPEKRLKAHRASQSRFFDRVASITWRRYPTSVLAREAEREAILNERPPFNVQGNPDNLPPPSDCPHCGRTFKRVAKHLSHGCPMVVAA